VTKIFKFLNKKKSIEDWVKIIQAGDEFEKNLFIREYIPFIKKTLSKQLGQYIEVENNDLYSIGLIAFNEAIDKYVESKGSFLNFATLVIKSRVIDQLRKDSKTGNEVGLNQLENDENNFNSIYLTAPENIEEEIQMKVDMLLFVEMMKKFGVTLDDLLKEAPKHKDTREMAVKIARYVHEEALLNDKVMQTQKLPISEIMEGLNVSKKMIQGSRKFIITIIVILNSDLDTLKSYITQI
jgi:RNA polymerase sigma factor